MENREPDVKPTGKENRRKKNRNNDDNDDRKRRPPEPHHYHEIAAKIPRTSDVIRIPDQNDPSRNARKASPTPLACIDLDTGIVFLLLLSIFMYFLFRFLTSCGLKLVL